MSGYKEKEDDQKLIELFNSLPDSYREFIDHEQSQILDEKSNYVILFSKKEAIEFNRDIEALELWPDYFFIARTELTVMIGFRINTMDLVCNPFISAPEDSIPLASSFQEFLFKVENEEMEIY